MKRKAMFIFILVLIGLTVAAFLLSVRVDTCAETGSIMPCAEVRLPERSNADALPSNPAKVDAPPPTATEEPGPQAQPPTPRPTDEPGFVPPDRGTPNADPLVTPAIVRP